MVRSDRGLQKKYFICLELTSLKRKLEPLLGASRNISLTMTCILHDKTFLHWLRLRDCTVLYNLVMNLTTRTLFGGSEPQTHFHL